MFLTFDRKLGSRIQQLLVDALQCVRATPSAKPLNRVAEHVLGAAPRPMAPIAVEAKLLKRF
jgi:hypothetical protein